MPLTPSRSPWWTVSTRTWPVRPSGRRGAQVVDVPDGDRREARVVRLAVHLELPPQNLVRGQPGHLVVGFVDLRQPPDVRRRVRARERPPEVPAAGVPDRSGLLPLPHQPLHLLERRARRGHEEPQNHTPCRACRASGSRSAPACPARSRTPRRGPWVRSPQPRCLPRRSEAARLCVAAASGCPRSSPDDAPDTRFTLVTSLTSRWTVRRVDAECAAL